MIKQNPATNILIPSSIYFMVFLVLQACSPPNTPMKIGTNLWLGYEPFYLAAKNEYFSENQVRLVEYTSASQVLRAYRNGAIDAAALTLDEAILLLENKFEPKMVLILDISNGADVILGQHDITSLAQLKGKRIGVENTALGAYVLSRALEIAGLRLNDVTIVSLEVDKHERAFVAREIDAVVTFEPTKSKLLSANANILFDSRQIPNEIVDILIVNKDYLEKHIDQITVLKSAWFKALSYIENNPEKAAKIMRSRQKLNLEEFNKASQGILFPKEKENANLIDIKNKKSLLPIAENLVSIMLERKLLHSQVDPRQLFLSQ